MCGIKTPAAFQQPQHRSFSLSQTIAQLWVVPLTFRPVDVAAAQGIVTSASSSVASPSAGGMVFVDGSYNLFGLGLTDPSCILLGCGVIARLSTILFSLYGDRCLARFACALPELHTAFRNYLGVADHPKSIGWERRVAKNKLTRERRRVFSLHGTGTMRTFMPHLIAACMFVYFAYGPAGSVASAAPISEPFIPLYKLIMGGDAEKITVISGSEDATIAAAAAPVSPLGSTLRLLDGALVLAAAISSYNVYEAIRRRKGFNNQLDRRVRIVSNYVKLGGVPVAMGLGYGIPLIAAAAATLAPSLVIGAAAATTTATAASSAASSTFFVSPFIPAYMPSFWLGAALTGLLQHPFNNVEPMRQIMDIPNRPPSHGTYGNQATGAMIDAMDSETPTSTLSSANAAQLLDDQERLEQWRKHKMLLDYESTLKIYQMLRKVGIKDDDDDMARDIDLLAIKVERAKELRAEEDMKDAAQRAADAATGHAADKPIHKEIAS